MQQTAINEMKALLGFSNSTSNYFENYKKTTSEPSCDKHEARFNGDSRFTVFTYKGPIQFNALTGYYGNSSCSTFGDLSDDLVKKYLPQALNVLKKDIFRIMGELAGRDAKLISDAAEKELNQLQEMVNDAKSMGL